MTGVEPVVGAGALDALDLEVEGAAVSDGEPHPATASADRAKPAVTKESLDLRMSPPRRVVLTAAAGSRLQPDIATIALIVSAAVGPFPVPHTPVDWYRSTAAGRCHPGVARG
ncbi:hypothetical protein [Saccharothrix saharensis]|uniref:hypothetical protein n=1 Tax=Saccharothrix saharensis TaxID=571190 RepID=UPI0014796D22|nr:hypothetical protein [Saccharothrix saharensis]